MDGGRRDAHNPLVCAADMTAETLRERAIWAFLDRKAVEEKWLEDECCTLCWAVLDEGPEITSVDASQNIVLFLVDEMKFKFTRTTQNKTNSSSSNAHIDGINEEEVRTLSYFNGSSWYTVKTLADLGKHLKVPSLDAPEEGPKEGPTNYDMAGKTSPSTGKYPWHEAS